jgi:TonB family protein
MRWRSDHWSIPFLMIASVWTSVFIAYQTGWISDQLHRMDDEIAAHDPAGLSFVTGFARTQLAQSHCDFGISLLEWVARGPNPPPAWMQADVLTCLEGAGRGEEAMGRLMAHCAALPPSESEVLPAFRANPLYPLEARLAGIEGHVVVSFAIFEDGSVGALETEDSEPPGVFDEAAIGAIQHWRYCPGSEHDDVQVRLSFEFEDAASPEM